LKSVIKITLVLVFVLLQMSLNVNQANASHNFTHKTICESNDGIWAGADSKTGTCTYVPGTGSFEARAASGCAETDTIVQEVVVEDIVSYTCVSPVSEASRVRVEPGRCRLISVDKPVYVGATFEAEWRGGLNSLRLREPGASILFLNPIPGSVHWTSNNSRVGTFATSGVVDVGNYFASCFGDEGMVGAEIKTIVRR
jgi:hypothetical protein